MIGTIVPDMLRAFLFSGEHCMKASLLCLFTLGLFSLSASAADAAAGKSLYASTCVACHGANAEGNPALRAPALAGQSAVYLQRQLDHFRGAQRGAKAGDAGGAVMAPMAKALADAAAVENVAAYLAGLPVPKVQATLAGDAVQGSKLYQAKCAACHGGKGEGNPAFSAPRLTQVGDVYLKTQVEHFRAGLRGYDPQDRYGKQMKLMSGTVNEAELINILAHLNAQGGQ